MKTLEFGRFMPHNISIEPTENNRFVVRVGCAVLTFISVEEVLEALGEYLANPTECEKTYTQVINQVSGPGSRLYISTTGNVGI